VEAEEPAAGSNYGLLAFLRVSSDVSTLSDHNLRSKDTIFANCENSRNVAYWQFFLFGRGRAIHMSKPPASRGECERDGWVPWPDYCTKNKSLLTIIKYCMSAKVKLCVIYTRVPLRNVEHFIVKRIFKR
jgi:hypothetical protein